LNTFISPLRNYLSIGTTLAFVAYSFDFFIPVSLKHYKIEANTLLLELAKKKERIRDVRCKTANERIGKKIVYTGEKLFKYNVKIEII
jgi:hypothetical protein